MATEMLSGGHAKSRFTESQIMPAGGPSSSRRARHKAERPRPTVPFRPTFLEQPTRPPGTFESCRAARHPGQGPFWRPGLVVERKRQGTLQQKDVGGNAAPGGGGPLLV